MTQALGTWFRRGLVGAAGIGALAVPLAFTGTASAATTSPAYHHQRCDETLTYVQLERFGGRFVVDRNVCDVQVFRNGFGRHHQREDVAWQTERFGFEQDHFAANVADVEVFH